MFKKGGGGGEGSWIIFSDVEHLHLWIAILSTQTRFYLLDPTTPAANSQKAMTSIQSELMPERAIKINPVAQVYIAFCICNSLVTHFFSSPN